MSDTFTQTTRIGWFDKLGQSIKNIGAGIIIFILATGLLFWNEGRAVRRAEVLSQGRGQVVSVTADAIKAENDQKLVHTSAQATTTQTLKDPLLNLSIPALRLTRSVEMYQWEETSKREEKKNVGGSTDVTTTYTYATVWKDKHIDSSTFAKPENHTNPSAFPVTSQVFTATPITVGAFTLDKAVFDGLSADESLAIEPTMLDEYRPASGSAAVLRQPPTLNGEYIYFASDYTTPKVGEIRIKYQFVPSQIVSVVAQQSGSTLRPYPINDDTINLISTGNKSADQMFTQAEDANILITWLARAFGVTLCMVAIHLLLSWIEAIADLIPFVSWILGIGTKLIAFLVGGSWGLIVIAIAWLWYRPLVSILIFAGIAAVWALFKFKVQPMMAARNAASAQAQATQTGTGLPEEQNKQ